eukprot:sb/3472106/
MRELKVHYESGNTKASDYIQIPEPQQMCCTYSVRDGEKQWYRAIIDRLVTDYQVEVTYVDYGSTEVVLKSSLRVPSKSVANLSRLPFQAFRVRLASLPSDPSAWTEQEVEKVKAYLKDQTDIKAQVQTSNTYYILISTKTRSFYVSRPETGLILATRWSQGLQICQNMLKI